MSKFYIGQKIVAIEDHSQRKFKKGDEFTVLGIRKGCCLFELNIGIESTDKNNRCMICDKTSENKYRIHWMRETLFEPIILSKITFEDVVKYLNLM